MPHSAEPTPPAALDPRTSPCALGPPEAFSDELAPDDYFDFWPNHDPARMGPTSEAVRRRILSSCAGWPRRPSGQEFYDALRTEALTPRQTALLGMWAAEASTLDLFDAWGERVYTWRRLVAALHRAGPLRTYGLFRRLNRIALVPTCRGIPLWTG